MRIRTAIAALLAVAAIAACKPPEETAPVDSVSAEPPPEEPISARCDAEAYQNLVGMNKAIIPEAPAGISFRVACTTCPVTDDLRTDRLNFFFDEKTDIIKEVKCG